MRPPLPHKQRVRLPRYVPDEGSSAPPRRTLWSIGFIAWAALVVLSASSQSLAASIQGWLGADGPRSARSPRTANGAPSRAPSRAMAAVRPTGPPFTDFERAPTLEPGRAARRRVEPAARRAAPVKEALAMARWAPALPPSTPAASTPSPASQTAEEVEANDRPSRDEARISTHPPSPVAFGSAPTARAPAEMAAAPPPPARRREAAPERAISARTEPRPPQPDVPKSPGSSVGMSCEQARATITDEVIVGQAAIPDVPRERYASLLNTGSYFAHCAGANSRDLDICVAVQHGHAVGITVTTRPSSRTVEQCVARAVSRLAFPRHPRLDVVRTSFR